MTRRAFVDHNQRICVYWSPKSASRTVLQWFLETFQGVRAKTGPEQRHLSNLAHYDAVRASVLVNENGYFSVAFVRHPTKRLLSAYLNKFVRTSNAALTGYGQLEPFAKSAVRDIFELQGRQFTETNYDGIRFADLIDLVDDRISNRKGEPDLNAHWNTQIPFFANTIRLRYDHVCAVESLDTDIKPLADKFGAFQSGNERNRTEYKLDAADNPENSAQSVADMTSVQLSGVSITSDQFLTDDVVSRIGSIYQNDFDWLGYDPVNLTEPPSIRASNKEKIAHKGMRAVCLKSAFKRYDGSGELTRFYGKSRG